MDYRTENVAVEQERSTNSVDRFASYQKAMMNHQKKEGKKDEKNA